MTIRNLQIFLDVVRSGSMSLAAKNLYLTQPTVSHAIACLEEEYKTQLFDRAPHGLTLTQSGEILAKEARNVLQALASLDESMQTLESRLPVKFGVSVTVAASILDGLIDEFQQMYPHIPLKFLISNTAEVEKALEENELDFAIVSGEIQNDQIEACKIISDYQVCVCCRTHPFAARAQISLRELSQEPMVMLTCTRWTRAAVETWMREQGYLPNIVCECTNTLLVKEQVKRRRGITVISARCVEKELLSGELVLVRCPGCFWQRPFVLAHRKNKYLSRPLEDFIRLAKSYTDHDRIIEMVKSAKI